MPSENGGRTLGDSTAGSTAVGITLLTTRNVPPVGLVPSAAVAATQICPSSEVSPMLPLTFAVVVASLTALIRVSVADSRPRSSSAPIGSTPTGAATR